MRSVVDVPAILRKIVTRSGAVVAMHVPFSAMLLEDLIGFKALPANGTYHGTCLFKIGAPRHMHVVLLEELFGLKALPADGAHQ